MFDLKVPILAIVIGEGGSGGALGIGIGNKVMIMENAYYSVITTGRCASILWKDRTFADKAAEALKISAKDLLELKVVDGVIEEPLGGAHRDWNTAAELVKKAIKVNLGELSKLSPAELTEQRYNRFRILANTLNPRPINQFGSPAMKKHIKVRPAFKSDVPAIKNLLAFYAKDGIVLPRSEQDILDHLENFVIAEHVDKLVGCAAVRDFGNSLFEVRSLALKDEYIAWVGTGDDGGNHQKIASG